MTLSYYGYILNKEKEYIPAQIIRVYTKQGDVTADKQAIYKSCNSEVISYYIIHNVFFYNYI